MGKQAQHPTVEKLAALGFDKERAKAAVATVSDKSDVQLCVEWLLDHGEEDKGGAVALEHCPHLDDLNLSLIEPSAMITPNSWACVHPGCGSTRENWLCLQSNQPRCSRYGAGHSLLHHKAQYAQEEGRQTVEEASRGVMVYGDPTVLSLTDLSVWCYACQRYVTHPRLKPLVAHAQNLKHGKLTPTLSPAPTPASSSSKLAAGAVMKGTHAEMHGRMGDKKWAPPRIAVACEQEARPGYRTKASHEFLDQEDVLRAKVKMLADMVRRSNQCIVYTGAGISTASGIGDYATKASNSLTAVKKVSCFQAMPTRSHMVLTAMERAGHLKHWVQQNHDGLPQKAGFPQHKLNEIHGAWYDPSNPVVPMSGTLRDDLIEWLVEWEERTDLCLAMGSSLCGMNADRVLETCCNKARQGQGLGGVIVSLQQTQHDGISSLRIFAKIDDVTRMLTEELQLKVLPPPQLPPPQMSAREMAAHKYTKLPYCPRTGERKTDGTTVTLNLNKGQKVRVVNQPDWDQARCNHEDGTMVGTSVVEGLPNQVHYKVKIGGRVRVLGVWWIAEAKQGLMERIPVVNVG